MTYLPALAQTDPEIRDAIIGEEKREWDTIRLIPSENYASSAKIGRASCRERVCLYV